MKIENSDIDALVETVGLLMTLAKKETNNTACGKLRNLASRVRKIYILLLHASGWTIADLKQMTLSNIYCDPELSKAIDALCPHLGLNSPSQQSEQEKKP
jgi:hypothetical protein